MSGWYNDCVLEFRIVAGLITLFPVLKVGSDLKLHQHNAVSSVVVEINISTQSQYAADLALLWISKARNVSIAHIWLLCTAPHYPQNRQVFEFCPVIFLALTDSHQTRNGKGGQWLSDRNIVPLNHLTPQFLHCSCCTLIKVIMIKFISRKMLHAEHNIKGSCKENIIHFFSPLFMVFLKYLNWHSACTINALEWVCLKCCTLATVTDTVA